MRFNYAVYLKSFKVLLPYLQKGENVFIRGSSNNILNILYKRINVFGQDSNNNYCISRFCAKIGTAVDYLSTLRRICLRYHGMWSLLSIEAFTLSLLIMPQLNCNSAIEDSLCCNLSAGVALNAQFTMNGMCAKNNTIYQGCHIGEFIARFRKTAEV